MLLIKNISKFSKLEAIGHKKPLPLLVTPPIKVRFDVISYVTKLPSEFKLQDYIDYDIMFQKTFLDPMRFILQSIGWEHEEKANLEAFFG